MIKSDVQEFEAGPWRAGYAVGEQRGTCRYRYDSKGNRHMIAYVNVQTEIDELPAVMIADRGWKEVEGPNSELRMSLSMEGRIEYDKGWCDNMLLMAGVRLVSEVPRRPQVVEETHDGEAK